MKTNFKKYMKAKAVLLMMLISLISFTGFSHTDPRQNSDVTDVVCKNADTITAIVGNDVQQFKFSYATPAVFGKIALTKRFSHPNRLWKLKRFKNDFITKIAIEQKAINLFKPLATIRAVNLYNSFWLHCKTNSLKNALPFKYLIRRTDHDKRC